MAGKNDNFNALMAMMALKHIMDDTKDIEIHPFTCEVTVTPTSISCSSSGVGGGNQQPHQRYYV